MLVRLDCALHYCMFYQQHNLGRRFGASKMHLGPPVALTAISSKTVALLFLIHCLLFLPMCIRVKCLVLILLFSTLCPSGFAVILMGKRELVTLLCIPDVL